MLVKSIQNIGKNKINCMHTFSNVLDLRFSSFLLETQGKQKSEYARPRLYKTHGDPPAAALPSAVSCCVVLVVWSQAWSMCVVIGKQNSVLSVFMFHYRPQCQS